VNQRTSTNWLSEALVIAGDLAGPIGLGDARQLWESALLDDAASFELTLSNLAAAGVDAWVVPTDRINPITLSALDDADADRSLAIIDEMVKRTRAAAGDIKLLGALGPVEPILALGEIEESEMAAAYQTQAQRLADAGIDAFLCRSFTELRALVLAVTACQKTDAAPVIASMSFDAGLDGLETVMGAGVVEMCDEMAKLGVDAVGADRTEFPDGLPAIISVMRGATDLPIYAEPNAGAAELGESGRVYPEKPATYAERYATISEAGANLVAGGLGTSAPHIAALIRARQVRQRKQAKQQG